MCGICGAYYFHSQKPVGEDLIDGMCRQIIHRGPDDQGTFVEGALGLGMRRLSIIDLVTGSQPIFNEDQTICTVFNGEIYNFQELRSDLIQRGHRFATEGDTEVIVHLYEEYGIDFVTHLNGMFAIALWDAGRRRLVIVRDRLGQKPLYYANTSDGIVFGSELKCITECKALCRDIDHESVYHFFTLGYIPHPWTIYRNVHQLPPAGRLIVEADRQTVKLDRYWQVNTEIDRSLSREDAGEELRRLVDDSVRRRMISDVPLGAFLSGGLDSSIIVALMAQHSSSPVKTFHIDFAESEYSERQYARAVAERFGTDHHELVVRPSAVDVLDELVHFFDEPFGDSSAVPTYYVSQITRQHVTVALAGDGGDESFGGYERYQRILRRRNLPGVLRKTLGGLGAGVHRCLPRTAPGRRYFRAMGLDHFRHFVVGTNEYETRELLTPEFLESLGDFSTFNSLRGVMEDVDTSDRLNPYSSFDLHYYLPDDICVKVDRMSMAHSLELRAPFLDYRVVELAARLPSEWKIVGDMTKVILKETFGGQLPDAVMKQRKWGFSLPMEHWLRGELKPALQEALEDPTMLQAGIFRMQEIRDLANEHWSGVRDRTDILWRYLFFRRWWHSRCHNRSPSITATS